MNSANCRTLKLVISAGGFNDDKFHVFALNQVAILVFAHPDLAVVSEHVGADCRGCGRVGRNHGNEPVSKFVIKPLDASGVFRCG